MNFLRTRFTFLKNFRRLDYVFILMFFVIFASLIVARLLRQPQWVTVGMYVSNEQWWWGSADPKYWLVDDIRTGLTARDTFGDEVAEIVNTQIFDIGGGQKQAFLELRLKAFYDRKKEIYTFESHPLEIGGGLNLTFEGQNVRGVITYLGDGSERQQPEVEAIVKIDKIDADLLINLSEPIQMTDSNGRVLASVMDISQQVYSKFEFSDLRGRSVETFDPQYRTVFMTVRMTAYPSGQDLYFVNGTPLKIGSEIWFSFDNFWSGKTMITKIERL